MPRCGVILDVKKMKCSPGRPSCRRPSPLADRRERAAGCNAHDGPGERTDEGADVRVLCAAAAGRCARRARGAMRVSGLLRVSRDPQEHDRFASRCRPLRLREFDRMQPSSWVANGHEKTSALTPVRLARLIRAAIARGAAPTAPTYLRAAWTRSKSGAWQAPLRPRPWPFTSRFLSTAWLAGPPAPPVARAGSRSSEAWRCP